MSEGTKQGAKNISSYLRAIEDSKNIWTVRNGEWDLDCSRIAQSLNAVDDILKGVIEA